VMVWFRDLAQASEAALIEAARDRRIGIYPVSPLFDKARRDQRADVVGLVMGYAALEKRQIEPGCQLLAQAVQQLLSRQRPR